MTFFPDSAGRRSGRFTASRRADAGSGVVATLKRAAVLIAEAAVFSTERRSAADAERTVVGRSVAAG